jgi:hypothetical protein
MNSSTKTFTISKEIDVTFGKGGNATDSYILDNPFFHAMKPNLLLSRLPKVHTKTKLIKEVKHGYKQLYKSIK